VTDEVLPAWLDRLRSSLSETERDLVADTSDGRPAGVLVLFGEAQDGPDLLFIQRASSLRSHPGQMAFPGGGIEPDDVDLVGAALREAEEETGLDPAGVEVFGELAPIGVRVSGFHVTPVLAWWRAPSPVSAMDPAEVASVHRISIARLTDPQNRYVMVHPSGYHGPGFLIDELLIWGFTGHVLNGILTRGGWQRSWDRNRTMAVPSRYLGRQTPVEPDLDAPAGAESDDR
jgi:8-oxo-dGTP pyrophosphatase MutT (NUDIX family)